MSALRSQLSRIPLRQRLRATNLVKQTRFPSITAAGSITAFPRCFSRVSPATPAGDIVKALKDDGCVVIESMFTPSQVSSLNSDLDAVLADATPGRPANANTPPLPMNLDAATFGHNTKRIGNLLNASEAFRKVVTDSDVLHDVSAGIFKETGDYWLSTAQMIEIGPGSRAQPLHADASGWWPFWSMGDRWTPELAVNFLIATTDTTKENGATGVVRESHKIKYSDALDDATFSFWRFPDEQVEQIELKAGDCLLLGGRMVHRGEENKTADEFRRILSCTIISSALTPEEAHPLLLKDGLAPQLSERAKRFLGFRELATTIGPDVWQDHRQGGLKRRLGF